MDAPNRFKAVYRRPLTTPAPLRTDDDEDWDAVIARAKMQAASARVPRPLPPPPVPPEMQETPPPSLAHQARFVRQSLPAPLPRPRDEWLETPDTPPPLPARRARPTAALDLLLAGGLKKVAAPRPAPAARRPAPEDQLTPPPLGRTRRITRSFASPTKGS